MEEISGSNPDGPITPFCQIPNPDLNPWVHRQLRAKREIGERKTRNAYMVVFRKSGWAHFPLFPGPSSPRKSSLRSLFYGPDGPTIGIACTEEYGLSGRNTLEIECGLEQRPLDSETIQF